MKTGITFGTFDMFHYGHLRILQRARALCDRLVVGVASDEFNMRKAKHRKPVFPWEHRAAIIGELRCVDEVFKEECEEKKLDYIRDHKADVFIMGGDYQGTFDWIGRELGIEIVVLPRTPDVSTTALIAGMPPGRPAAPQLPSS